MRQPEHPAPGGVRPQWCRGSHLHARIPRSDRRSWSTPPREIAVPAGSVGPSHRGTPRCEARPWSVGRSPMSVGRLLRTASTRARDVAVSTLAATRSIRAFASVPHASFDPARAYRACRSLQSRCRVFRGDRDSRLRRPSGRRLSRPRPSRGRCRHTRRRPDRPHAAAQRHGSRHAARARACRACRAAARACCATTRRTRAAARATRAAPSVAAVSGASRRFLSVATRAGEQHGGSER